jgi:hypothetical protein
MNWLVLRGIAATHHVWQQIHKYKIVYSKLQQLPRVMS